MLNRRKLGTNVIHVAATRSELRFKLRIVSAESELDAAVGNERLNAGKQGIGMGFADAIGMKPLEKNRRLFSALREQARNHLLFEHAAHFARNARRKEEARFADVERKTARGTNGVINQLGARRQHRLFLVVGR